MLGLRLNDPNACDKFDVRLAGRPRLSAERPRLSAGRPRLSAGRTRLSDDLRPRLSDRLRSRFSFLALLLFVMRLRFSCSEGLPPLPLLAPLPPPPLPFPRYVSIEGKSEWSDRIRWSLVSRTRWWACTHDSHRYSLHCWHSLIAIMPSSQFPHSRIFSPMLLRPSCDTKSVANDDEVSVFIHDRSDEGMAEENDVVDTIGEMKEVDDVARLSGDCCRRLGGRECGCCAWMGLKNPEGWNEGASNADW